MPKLTAKIAANMVSHIEELQAKIDTVYANARAYDGVNNDSIIRDIVGARARAKDAKKAAFCLLESLDCDDEAQQ